MRYLTRAIILILLSASLVLLITVPTEAQEGYNFSTRQEIREIAPGAPVRIKLKRTSEGRYTWEITGTDVKRILEADRTLREYVDAQKAQDITKNKETKK